MGADSKQGTGAPIGRTSVEGPSGSAAALLASAPMSVQQWLVVGLCVLLNALDGFDVLAVAFAAPGISADWKITSTTLGGVISAGLAGMVLGSVFVAPLADQIGRRPTVLICLVLMTAGMLWTAVAPSIPILCAARVLTGLGVGGMLAAINAVAAEFSNERRRDFAVSLMTVGYPLGGLVGGALAALLLGTSGWRAIFTAGGLATAVLIPVIWLWLPESLEFLAARGGERAKERISAVLARLGHPGADVEVVKGKAPERADPRELFRPPFLPFTLRLIAGYFFFILTFYFFSGWLPKIMTDRGFTAPDAVLTAAIMNGGGVLSGMAVGWLAPRVGLKRLTILSMLGTSVTMVAFGILKTDLQTLRAVGLVLGIFTFGGIVGLYAFLARGFPARLRVTGAGITIACGRGGAVLGPLIGGVLLDAGLGAGAVLSVVGVAAALAALVMVPIPLGAPSAKGQ